MRAAQMVEDGMVIGIGSGSTAAHFIEVLGRRVQTGLRIRGVPTSNRTAVLAQSVGIPLTDLRGNPHLDLDIDGADEIDPHLNVLKGGGGALLHEKIVALASECFVVIAEETKLVSQIGSHGVPVEVVAFGWAATQRRLEGIAAGSLVRGGLEHPYVTDSGNLILDVLVPVEFDVFRFVDEVKKVTGVVDHGVFRHIATSALIGRRDGSVEALKPAEDLGDSFGFRL